LRQVIIPTSEKYHRYLPGFIHLWHKYINPDEFELLVCSSQEVEGYSGRFYQTSAYSSHEWSNKLIEILDTAADDVFMLLLEDYWLVRQADVTAIKMMYDYMRQFEYVIKFDLCSDRLNADPGYYAYNNNTYDTLGYLDLIKSKHNSPYHMSLWGGLWRRDLMRKVLIPGETAQQIELNGTHRLSQYGDDILVLGTRQSPLKHANAVQAGKWNHDALVGLTVLREDDRKELEELGFLSPRGREAQ
jgi:hypothetical protein